MKTTEAQALGYIAQAQTIYPQLDRSGIRGRGEPIPVAEVIKAAEFVLFILGMSNPLKRPNRSSYGLKHDAERWIRWTMPEVVDDYVSNGALIAAAIGLGFKPFPMPFVSPNVDFGFSRKATKRASEETRAGAARAAIREAQLRAAQLREAA